MVKMKVRNNRSERGRKTPNTGILVKNERREKEKTTESKKE
jgi:hypothetical protein